MNDPTALLETLIRSDMFRTYERSFSETTGLPITLRPVETWQLPFHGKRRESPWCALMAEKSHTCAACLQMQEELEQTASDKPGTSTCAYGLSETAVPVKAGVQTIGFLQTGQMVRREPSEASFRRAMTMVKKKGVKLKPSRARDAYFATPVIPKRRLESIAGLMSIFADHLSVKANQIAIQTENREVPMITKAKQYIREHFAEDLSLGKVAMSVNTSHFYFCKLFKKATGTTFTEFLSRTRVEKAKDLLLNRNFRVGEVAYEVGFQSLTHFNRTFKNIVGESPTAYRAKLPGINNGTKTAGIRRTIRKPHVGSTRRTTSLVLPDRWEPFDFRNYSQSSRVSGVASV